MATLTLSNDFVLEQLDYMIYIQNNLDCFDVSEYTEEESIFYFHHDDFEDDCEVKIRFVLDEEYKPISHEVFDPIKAFNDMLKDE